MHKTTMKQLDPAKLMVSPSILAADFSILGDEIKRVEAGGAEIIHLDVMDGHLVPNLTIGPPLIKSIRKVTDLTFDTHLMITDPLKFVEPFALAGSDHITFHIESDGDPDEIIAAIRSFDCSAGITLKPGTPVEDIIPYLEKIDMVLVMTVEPGFGGQSFMADMMPKVSALRGAIIEKQLPVHIQVDGGIDAKTVETAAAAGANVMVAGTSVFRNPGGADVAIKQLHDAQSVLRTT